MTIVEAMQLPELPPVQCEIPDDGLGFIPLASEGEHTWNDQHGHAWWTETVDGVRYRRTWAE